MLKLCLAVASCVSIIFCMGCSDESAMASPSANPLAAAVNIEVRPDPQDDPTGRSQILPHSTNENLLHPPSGRGEHRSEPLNSIHLPAESIFVDREGISAEESDQILETDKSFNQALRKMSDDEKKSMEAQDLSKHYRRALELAVGTTGAVENLSCGLSLCIGSVRAGSVEDHDAWLSRLYKDPGALSYGFIETIERTGDQYQSRFVFSTDPDLKAITVR